MWNEGEELQAQRSSQQVFVSNLWRIAKWVALEILKSKRKDGLRLETCSTAEIVEVYA